jgi:hypothetical protein
MTDTERQLTAAELSPGDRLRDTEGHGLTNRYGPAPTDEVAVKKRWHGDAWLIGAVLENGRVGSGNATTAVSFEEIDARLASGRYVPVDVEAFKTLDYDRLPFAEGTDVYIRFGDVPDDERSYDHADDRSEAGVSAFACSVSGAPPDTPHAAVFHPTGPQVLGVLLLMNRPTYLLTGEEVGTGADGEPLLRNVSTLASLSSPNGIDGFVIDD